MKIPLEGVVHVKTMRTQDLAKKLYAEIQQVMDANGSAPICRIEVTRLLGTIYLYCVPVRITQKMKYERTGIARRVPNRSRHRLEEDHENRDHQRT